ncbi:diadenylate cyclase CdaA [Acetatifactor muris]|jgi:diadenylate cyclase|uniref:Diadenylate cyclase n=1 Tax=Acetatifactor muris TaxID=879566 RepID=A0A2K4ZKB5_9FIRM|nr:diadenylate cyclase CdaA [Acetatifactor muris]MCI8798873.1 TIGR00159 family protein [Lachnospiraceae bacterium]MCR2049186.1 diadenylate cyclase CdaA [Acetatifactor muris]SOY30895.1 DNA integrity scanning protein DisA [Acetatifactor muris]
MQWQWLKQADDYLNSIKTYANTVDLLDVAEMLIIAFLVYYILAWMKTTRSWRMLKGLIVIFLFLAIVYIMEMTTIIRLAQNVLGFAVTALIVVLQPELRQALEQLGQKNFLPSIGFSDSSAKKEDAFSERTVNEITKACAEMGKVKTGALIVIERVESLKDYERTGIEVDAIVSSQLLINIFEHNTPLHDGAVIVRGNRITYATCYLPLSDNLGLSKDLGTRHRAGVGISEATDSLTLIVSEETGGISVAHEGKLERHLNAEELKSKIRQIMKMDGEEDAKGRHRRKGKGKAKGEEQAAE